MPRWRRRPRAPADERDCTRSLLDDAKAKAKLPVLDNIRVASPCKAAWDDMVGDDRVRHCRACDKSVFDLSAMTRDEAESLIVATAGNLCARYYQRADGTILTQDCAVGVARSGARRLRVIAAGAAALMAAGGVAAYARGVPDERMQHAQELIGSTVDAPPPVPMVAAPVAHLAPDVIQGGIRIIHDPVPLPAAREDRQADRARQVASRALRGELRESAREPGRAGEERRREVAVASRRARTCAALSARARPCATSSHASGVDTGAPSTARSE